MRLAVFASLTVALGATAWAAASSMTGEVMVAVAGLPAVEVSPPDVVEADEPDEDRRRTWKEALDEHDPATRPARQWAYLELSLIHI